MPPPVPSRTEWFLEVIGPFLLYAVLIGIAARAVYNIYGFNTGACYAIVSYLLMCGIRIFIHYRIALGGGMSPGVDGLLECFLLFGFGAYSIFSVLLITS